MSEPRSRETAPWPAIASGVAALVAAVFLASAWSRWPVARETLTVAEAVGPVVADDEWVFKGSRAGSHRAQRIVVVAAGQALSVSPSPGLWVGGLDEPRRGEVVRFLVDPGRGLAYEAMVGGRTLLAYATSAAAKREKALVLVAVGLAAATLGALQLWRILAMRR